MNTDNIVSQTLPAPVLNGRASPTEERIFSSDFQHSIYDLGSTAVGFLGKTSRVILSPSQPHRTVWCGCRWAQNLTNQIKAVAELEFFLRGELVLRLPYNILANVGILAGGTFVGQLSPTMDFHGQAFGTAETGQSNADCMVVGGVTATEYFTFFPQYLTITADEAALTVRQYNPTVVAGFYAFSFLGVRSSVN